MEDQPIEKEIAQCKARINEIAVTRPVTIELSQEYSSLEKKLTHWEVEVRRRQRKERASLLSQFEIAWDLRTDNIDVTQEASTDKSVAICFSHAPAATAKATLISRLSFTGVLALITSRISFTDRDDYVLGIPGINALGIHEVFDSARIKSLPEHEQADTRHFCIVFANVTIEVLANDIRSQTQPLHDML